MGRESACVQVDVFPKEEEGEKPTEEEEQMRLF
jgi:hypothetical protein